MGKQNFNIDTVSDDEYFAVTEAVALGARCRNACGATGAQTRQWTPKTFR